MLGSTALGFVAFGLAPFALAQEPPAVGLGIGLGMPPPTPTPTPSPRLDDVLVRRNLDSVCVSSVLAGLAMPLTSVNPNLLRWARASAAAAATAARTGAVAAPTSSCTMTAPASLSTAFTEYLSILDHYLHTIDAKAAAVSTDCGAPGQLSLSFTGICTTSITLLFVDANNMVTTTSVPPLHSPPNRIPIGPQGAATITSLPSSSHPPSASNSAAAAPAIPNLLLPVAALAAVLGPVLAL
ncbi:hypothetical protein DCS_04076 [Drechmeria coniospora]|uniref:Infection structure specific protein n=1 Tax=Drechmeria coniospora TaxID=98403 RepID=A0A151GJ17_DRECN|nr:hypothetical protein DCS_04076 [Drechmeria coniospora]KYK57069.1 hypothetical protein DCS_04076 [Drechmeria coniospora]ODA78969.1 hypothetical protein RJ55_04559 [Drechmeria coniospora]